MESFCSRGGGVLCPLRRCPTQTAVPGSVYRHRGALIQGTVVTQLWSPQETGRTVQGDSTLDAQEGPSRWEPAWWSGGQVAAFSHPRAVSLGSLSHRAGRALLGPQLKGAETLHSHSWDTGDLGAPELLAADGFVHVHSCVPYFSHLMELFSFPGTLF